MQILETSSAYQRMSEYFITLSALVECNFTLHKPILLRSIIIIPSHQNCVVNTSSVPRWAKPTYIGFGYMLSSTTFRYLGHVTGHVLRIIGSIVMRCTKNVQQSAYLIQFYNEVNAKVSHAKQAGAPKTTHGQY